MKFIATREGQIADASHTAPDCHALKSGATLEGIRRNDFYIIAYIYCCKIRTTFEYRIIIRTCTCAFGCVPIYRHKTGATIEGIITDARYAVGDCRALKPGATIESRSANARHAVGNCNALKSGATIEGRIADASHAVRDYHALKPGATTESL